MNKKLYSEFLQNVYKRNPNANHETLDRLHGIAKSVHRLGELSCNFGLTDRQDKREDRLVAEARKLAESIGAQLYYQGDPRGWEFSLYFPQDLKPGQTPESDGGWHGVGIPNR